MPRRSSFRAGTTNYFSIAGHQDIGRNFFVNSAYNGCASDTGWFAIVSGKSCTWETFTTTPQVLFSPYGTTSKSDGGTDGWQAADTFTVFADYDMVYERCVGFVMCLSKSRSSSSQLRI